MTVFVLQEEVDVVAVFKTRELALKFAAELELKNFIILVFHVRGD
jgi:predicted CoA-binding protein